MLELARALGPSMLVFYNGARCGASAPDHFHFQACAARDVPLVGELGDRLESGCRSIYHRFGRVALTASEAEPSAMKEIVNHTVSMLAHEREGDLQEPMFNLLMWFRDATYSCALFPRVAHRPACYFSSEPATIGVSPAALEMAGLLVVSNPDHFERVTAEVARAVYAEVSMSREQLQHMIEATR